MSKKPGMSEGAMINEQMPLTKEDIQNEIKVALEHAQEIAKDVPEFEIDLKGDRVFIEISYDNLQSNDQEEQDKEIEKIKHAAGDAIRSIEEKGYKVEWRSGNFDEKGYGDTYGVEESETK